MIWCLDQRNMALAIPPDVQQLLYNGVTLAQGTYESYGARSGLGGPPLARPCSHCRAHPSSLCRRHLRELPGHDSHAGMHTRAAAIHPYQSTERTAVLRCAGHPSFCGTAIIVLMPPAPPRPTLPHTRAREHMRTHTHTPCPRHLATTPCAAQRVRPKSEYTVDASSAHSAGVYASKKLAEKMGGTWAGECASPSRADRQLAKVRSGESRASARMFAQGGHSLSERE